MKKYLTALGLLVFALVCASGALADAVWMETMTNDGTKYKGYVENGELNGFGIAQYSNGNQYFGMHANGLRNGFGIYIYADTEENASYILVGNYLDGLIMGYGIAQDKSGFRYEGPFDGGGRAAKIGYTRDEHGFVRGALLDSDIIYTGEVIPDTTIPYGFGIAIEPDGSIYIGRLDSGFREGFGICVTPDKRVTQGFWDYDALSDSETVWE